MDETQRHFNWRASGTCASTTPNFPRLTPGSSQIITPFQIPLQTSKRQRHLLLLTDFHFQLCPTVYILHIIYNHHSTDIAQLSPYRFESESPSLVTPVAYDSLPYPAAHLWKSQTILTTKLTRGRQGHFIHPHDGHSLSLLRNLKPSPSECVLFDAPFSDTDIYCLCRWIHYRTVFTRISGI